MRWGCVFRLGGLVYHLGPAGVEEFATRFVDSLVGVRAKEIPLCLQEVGWQDGAAVAVEISK